jgi:hypothetical protein
MNLLKILVNYHGFHYALNPQGILPASRLNNKDNKRKDFELFLREMFICVGQNGEEAGSVGKMDLGATLDARGRVMWNSIP